MRLLEVSLKLIMSSWACDRVGFGLNACYDEEKRGERGRFFTGLEVETENFPNLQGT